MSRANTHTAGFLMFTTMSIELSSSSHASAAPRRKVLTAKCHQRTTRYMYQDEHQTIYQHHLHTAKRYGDKTDPCLTPEETLNANDQLQCHLTHAKQCDSQFSKLDRNISFN